MPINRLILEIDDRLMTENFVTFNMIDFHRFLSIVIDYRRLSLITILSHSVVSGLRYSISAQVY